MRRVTVGGLILAMLLLVLPLSAQQQLSELRILRTSTAALPSIDITIAGQDADGTPLDLSNELILIKHNDQVIDNAEVIGNDQLGTLTLFLLDLPPGVSGEIDSMKNAIQTFTTPDFMQEQIDDVAIYRVDELGALEMQAPTFFYNDVINMFTLGIETQSGPTALRDSIGDLLTKVDSLKRDPNMATSIVVFSDGTDSISTQFDPAQLYGLARDQGVKIYTVLVDNSDLVFATEAGRDFMEEMAAETGGGSVLLPDVTGTKIQWSAIASYGEQPVVRYTPDSLEAGTANIEVSLPNLPTIAPATTSVSIPATLPQVAINVPDDARTLAVEELVTPVSLGLPTTISWLDGATRTIEQAQLWVNGSPFSEIEPSTIARVTADVPLNFGENNLQVVIVDSDGQTAKSPPLTLTVEQGAQSIPREIRPGSAFPWRILLYVLVCIFIIALLILLFNRLRQGGGGNVNYGGWRKRMTEARADRKRKQELAVKPSKAGRKPAAVSKPQVAAPAAAPAAPARPSSAEYTSPSYGATTRVSTPVGMPTIEVLDAKSSAAAQVPVNRSEFLIGRSPTVDLALTEDATVSRIHATIVEDNGVYRIYDEQSTSGTYVNDREVPEYGLQLTTGDEIHIGAVHLRFVH